MEAKSLLRHLNPHDLIQVCNEKMVCAARDLAEFTKNGINASFIVALAHKCESYEENLRRSESVQPIPDRIYTEKEIKEGVERICKVGQSIWSQDSSKYNDYVILSQQVSRVSGQVS